ncbi:hypothetical protein SAMN05428977_10256 [Nitrosomonas sp. Nm166]|nr:hypothetical protein SAMN05428977_10256 [Nitrosomonas sp. Nm166]
MLASKQIMPPVSFNFLDNAAPASTLMCSRMAGRSLPVPVRHSPSLDGALDFLIASFTTAHALRKLQAISELIHSFY